MMMSMYSAVSGLKSQQTRLNVIGNNIANINTLGYKSQTVSFSDLLSQTISAAGAASGTTGGTNAKQIGLGTQVASISTDMNTGSSQYTGSDTDVALSGEGFFVVQGGGVGQYQFTRAGNFGVDSDGNLVVNGMKVCGWDSSLYDSTTDTFNTQSAVQPVNLFTDANGVNKKVIAPQVTSTATLTGNLDNSGTDTSGTTPVYATGSSTITIYDALGVSHDATVTFTNQASGTTGSLTWDYAITFTDGTTISSGDTGTVIFDSNGTITGTDNTDLGLTFANGATASTVNVKFTGISAYATSSGTSSVSVSDSDGYASGTLQDFSIGTDGVITGSYSNGQKQALGMLGLATFTNPSGLEKIGENLYTTTVNSGSFTGAVAAGTGGSGSLTTGALEMSNVDLASQFSDMMITQRAYQANSKIITTSDTLLETLINMSR